MSYRTWMWSIVLVLGFLSNDVIEAGPPELIEFTIKDQFDHVHTDVDLRGHFVLIFGSDRKGSRFSGQWFRALRESLQSRGDSRLVDFVEIADLRGVPFFVKGSVKRKFPREPDKRVLLDWEGVFATSYAFENDACNILLLDRDGGVVRQTAQTELNPEVVSELSREVERLALRLRE